MIGYVINKCEDVRESCKRVVDEATHVRIVEEKIPNLIEAINYHPVEKFHTHMPIEEEQKSLAYFFILNSMNFCLWQVPDYSPFNLVAAVRSAVQKNQLTLQKLKIMDEKSLLSKVLFRQESLKQKLFQVKEFPQAKQRARILRDLANVVLLEYGGSFKRIIEEAVGSAVKLVHILTSRFTAFQDHAIYKGEQIKFYKKAQLLVRDIWANFKQYPYAEFPDIHQLTALADYRVPQVLKYHGVLSYQEQLDCLVVAKKQLASGSEMEIEIRASSVVAVDKVRDKIQQKFSEASSIQVDYFLYTLGEGVSQQLGDHHRTLTIYY